MPQEAEEGKRFARDMSRIREARNLSIGDLHEETKIPLGLIQAFEETGLFDHPQFNRVYLRSFVRTYANVVGVNAEKALESLEDALAGRYSGSLAAEYLDEEPEPSDSEAEAARETPRPDAEKKPTAESERGAAASRQEEKETADRSHDAEPDRRRREPPIVSTTSEAAASRQERAREEEEEVDEDWAAQSPPSGRRTGAAAGAGAAAGSARDRAGTRRTGAGTTGSRRSRDVSGTGGIDRRWLIAGAMIVVVAVVVWILIAMLGGDDAAEQAGGTVTPADTAQTADTTGPPMQTAAPIDIPAIGDTMNVYIVAADGPVDPIRVTVDDDLRRPYWIDQGDSMAFNPANRIVVEELLDNIDLQVEGIPYPTDRRDAQGRIVITRDSLENYFASLEENPELLNQFGDQVLDQLQDQDEGPQEDQQPQQP